MERRKAGDFAPQVLQPFDGFVHGRISRRELLDRGSPATACRPRPRKPRSSRGSARSSSSAGA